MSARSILRRTLTGIFIILLVGICATLLSAEGGTKKLRVESSRVVSTKKTDKIRETVLADAKIYHEDAIFVAQTIVMQSEDNVHEFTCTGNPVFTDPETKITAQKVVGLSTPRRAEFSGNVKMVSTPKKKGKDTEKPSDIKDKVKEPTTLTSDTLSYDYSNKLGAAKGNVVVVQKNRTVWADEGYYDQNLEKILLKGNVRLKNTGEEELKELKDADTVTVSLEDDWIDIVAKPGGVVVMDLDVKDEETKTPAKGQEKK